MKRIVIIDHFSQIPGEPGNNRFIYLAQMLCDCGYAVEIITTDFAHKIKRTRAVDPALFEQLPYRFTMLPEPGYPKNICLRRFYSHYVFGRNLKKHLDGMERPDLVYVAVPSLDVGRVAAAYCKKNEVPFFVDVQDVWPEAFKLVFNIPLVSELIFAPMTHIANRFYAVADKIVAVSETYKRRGLQSNQKDAEGLCVYLGTDLRVFDENANRVSVMKRDDELWIAYVGTLGHSYNLEIVLDALNRLPQELIERLKFKVLGDGPLMERFKQHASNGRVSVEFMGRLEYPEMAAYLSRTDVAVNPIAKGAAQSIINKHADYAAAGLPVVSTQECPEYRALLDEFDCGINCPPEDTQAVADALEGLLRDPALRKKMGENSRRMAQERFDRKHTYQQIIAEIERFVR